MPQGGDSDGGTGVATVADRPGAKQPEPDAASAPAPPSLPAEAPAPPILPAETPLATEPGLTVPDRPRTPSATDLGAQVVVDQSAPPSGGAARREQVPARDRPRTPSRSPNEPGTDTPEISAGGMSLTTAVDALRDEEVARTRTFIVLGWLLSVGAIAIVPLLPSPRFMQIAMVSALLLGMVGSFFFFRAFADPKKFTERALLWLAVMCIVNSHVAIMYLGVFTLTPVVIVIGMHFLGRTEAVRTGKWILSFACLNYAVIAGLIITGVIRDPGVFATPRQLSAATHAIGAVFVLGMYVLAFMTGRMLRLASIDSIDELARATRVASQREALMAEIRADLERALRVGGPGRYTDQKVGVFKLGIVIGRGAMGEVYEAVHEGTHEPAAVKLLRRELLSDATHLARFLREAKASGALASPFVVHVLDTSPPEAALPYIAMERLHGATLAEILRRESRLTPDTLVELVKQAGAGIDAAAAAGIVHRDLKPQNLFRTEIGGWKILDFGVATLAEESVALTQGGIVGTPNYMAPEQAQGKRVDSRADIYALAAVSYRCLTARHPFTAADTPSLLYAVVHKMPQAPSTLAELHADVDACLAIALAKDPDDRFASGAELADALGAAVAGSLAPGLRARAASLLRRRPWEPVS